MSRRFVFITQEDPFYVRIFFDEFLRRWPKLDEIGAVFVAPSMGKRSIGKLARQMYDFYGPADFLRLGTRYVRYKLAAKLPLARGAKRYYSIAQACRAYGVPVEHVPDVNASEFINRLKAMQPDLVVSVAAPQIFREPLIGIPRLGCINIHNSKLPKYRGMLPNFWQLYNGERSVGTSIHRINASLDDGAILLQRETPIEPNETLENLILRTKRQGAEIMVEAVERLLSGNLEELPNDRTEASYYSFPTKQHVIEFRRRGLRLI